MKRVLVFEYLCAGGAAALQDEGGLDALAVADLLAQGQAMRDAMVADLLQLPGSRGLQVHVACGEGAPALPAGALPCPIPAGTAAARWLASQAPRFDLVWAVAPETGGVLAECCAAVPPARWLGCEAAAIALCSRKRATLARLAAQGLRTPLAFAEQARRWVTKPDDGAGAVATQVHGQLAAAHAASCRGEPGMTTLEPWVEGEPLSLSLLCLAGGCELLAVNRQRIALDDQGLVHFHGVEIDVLPRQDPRWPSLALLARRISQAVPGLRGFVGVDIVWHETEGNSGPVVVEINPRLTSAYVGLSARLGRGLAAELLAAWSLADAA